MELLRILSVTFGLEAGTALTDTTEKHSTFFITIQRTRLHYPIIGYAILFPTRNWESLRQSGAFQTQTDVQFNSIRIEKPRTRGNFNIYVHSKAIKIKYTIIKRGQILPVKIKRE